MSERHKALMKTRCGECGAIFRVTLKQLQVKFGKVRCGQCNTVFNAFDTLITDEANALPLEKSLAAPADQQAQSIEVTTTPNQAFEINPAPTPEAEPELVFEPEQESPTPAPIEPTESIEESTTAARQAGLVAARELTQVPNYNRWSEGTLTGSSLSAFSTESQPAARWPFALVALALLFTLSFQLVLHFRTELTLHEPAFAGFFQSLAVNVPLPRNSELLTIETSDLQSDNARGLLILHATLRNRAAHDQAWPALELSLTDTQDTVLARRILTIDDYRPPDTNSPAFPALAEQSVRLAIDAKEIGAAGYRLYLFYP
ncbi:MAG: DUF3426 domain-containing protein [Rhodocyclaceae bacterium]|nr:DUF3426 domain-containing protein [Rhodocyclaceae bacterium]